VLFVYFQSLPHHMDSYKPPIEEFSLFIEGGCCYARSQPIMAEESLHVTMQRTASPGVLCWCQCFATQLVLVFLLVSVHCDTARAKANQSQYSFNLLRGEHFPTPCHLS